MMRLKQTRGKAWGKGGLLVITSLILLLSSCGEPPKATEQDETLQASNSANYTTHLWYANSSSYTSIGYDSEKFCYLSSIQGNFAGSNDSARVYTHYGSWILAVNSSTGSTVGAEATCVKWSALSTPTLSPANSVKWLSPEFSATAAYSGNPDDCTVPYVQTWWGDAAYLFVRSFWRLGEHQWALYPSKLGSLYTLAARGSSLLVSDYHPRLGTLDVYGATARG
jgi:hypothetical protein